jgi:GH43 family beta-xylosidase
MDASPSRLRTMTYSNPVYSESFPDPFVFRHEDRYYAVATGRVCDNPSGPSIFPTLTSDDMIHWHPGDPAMVAPDPSLGSDFWAPEIAYRNDRFYLYYSVGQEDKGHQLRVAVSDSPAGPYVDSGKPILDPAKCAFAIDAHPFQAIDGRWFLFYARDFFDTSRPGTSIVVTPLDDPLQISPEFTLVARASKDWQRFQASRRMHGQIYDWHTLEGPCVVGHEGKYFCLYSGGNWQNESYGLDYVVADRIEGPYRDASEGAPRILRTVPDRVVGPGHNSIVVGPDEIQYLAYHAWDTDRSARRLCLDRLVWTNLGPRCPGPSTDPQLISSGPEITNS